MAKLRSHLQQVLTDEETAVWPSLEQVRADTTHPVTPEAEILTFNLLGNQLITGTNIVCGRVAIHWC